MNTTILPGRTRFSPVSPAARPCAGAPAAPAVAPPAAPATISQTIAPVVITPPPPPPAPAPAPPASKLKKVSFGKAPKKEEKAKTEYPVFTGDPHTCQQVFEIAARIKRRNDELEALQGAQETDKAELKMFALPFYFQHNYGKTTVPSSISIPSEAGEVLVTFQNRYKKLTDESALVPLLGDDLENYFRQAFALTIKGELLPVDRAQAIVNEIQELLARHHAADALEIAEEIKPVKTFHEARHTKFTPEQNLALDAAAPVVAMIKVKGRGGDAD